MALKKTIKVGIGLISWVTLCNCVKTLDNPYRFSPYEQSHSYYRERYKARGQKVSDFEAQRENDKFLYKYSKNYKQKEDGLGFLLDEEVAPDGVTHGGYGYVDDQGDLVYIEYEKSPRGQVSKTDEKKVPQYQKYPTSSNQVEGRTFDLIKSKDKRKPVHKYAKKTAKRLISEPVIEYGFVPIKDEPNLFHKEYYTQNEIAQPSDDNLLPLYGPPYHDSDIIHHTVNDNHVQENHSPKKTTKYHSPKKTTKYHSPKKTTEFIPVEYNKQHKKKTHTLHSNLKPNFGSVGYQQIITHGINTYYDIPKTDKDINQLQFEDDLNAPLIGQEINVKDPFGTKFNVESYLKTHEEKLPLNHFKSGNQDLHKEIRLNFKFEEGPPGGSEIVKEENKNPYFPLTKLLKSDLNLLKPIEDTFFKKLRKGKEKSRNKEKVGMGNEHFPSTNVIVHQNNFFPKPSRGNGNENNAGHAQPGHSHAGQAHADHAQTGHANADHNQAGHAQVGHAQADHAHAGHAHVGHAQEFNSVAHHQDNFFVTPFSGKGNKEEENFRKSHNDFMVKPDGITVQSNSIRIGGNNKDQDGFMKKPNAIKIQSNSIRVFENEKPQFSTKTKAPIFKRLTTPEPKPIKTLQQFTAVPSKKDSSPPPPPKKTFPIWNSASIKPFRIAETPFREEIIHQTNIPIHQLNSPNHHLNSEDETRKLRKQKSSGNLAIIPAENKPYNHPNTPVPYSTLHGKLVSDNESGKKRGAIIHANEITDGFQKVSKGFQNPSNRRPPATRPSLSQWPSPSPSPIPSPSPPQHRFHIPHFSTTLPPLVQVSALPKLVRQTHAIKPYKEKPKPRPFFSSTPATYLVNPSTSVSTLRPVVRPTTPKSRVIHVTTAVPENVHVTVTSHGDNDINVNAFPVPPIPTYSSKTVEHLAYPIISTTTRPPKLPPVLPRKNYRPKSIFRIKPQAKRTKPPFLTESLSQIPNPFTGRFNGSLKPPPPVSNHLVDEIKNFVDDGFVKPQNFYSSQTTLADVDQLPIRPNVFGLPARLTRPFRSTKTLIHNPESNRLFGKNYKQQQAFKTVPLQQPYLMPLDVQLENTSATRKLRDFGVYRAQSRNFDEANPTLEPTVEISRLSTPVTKSPGNGNLRFPKSFGDQNIPFFNNLRNSVHTTNLKHKELPLQLSQTTGNRNSRFSQTFANQNMPFSQTPGNPVLSQQNKKVEISELPPLLRQTSGNGNLRFSQSFVNQNQPFLQTSGNLVFAQGNGNVEMSELPSQLAQTFGNGNIKFSQTLRNQNIPFSQPSRNPPMLEGNTNVKISELPLQLAHTSRNGNSRFSQTFENQNLPLSLISDKENLSLSQGSGNGNVNEDYLIAAAAHYTFERL